VTAAVVAVVAVVVAEGVELVVGGRVVWVEFRH
jgi:hypothetical protein